MTLNTARSDLNELLALISRVGFTLCLGVLLTYLARLNLISAS